MAMFSIKIGNINSNFPKFEKGGGLEIADDFEMAGLTCLFCSTHCTKVPSATY